MSQSLFWRNPDIPQVELRRVEDGRKVNYAPHSHQQWSIGAITSGVARYLYRQDSYAIAEQDLVMMKLPAPPGMPLPQLLQMTG